MAIFSKNFAPNIHIYYEVIMSYYENGILNYNPLDIKNIKINIDFREDCTKNRIIQLIYDYHLALDDSKLPIKNSISITYIELIDTTLNAKQRKDVQKILEYALSIRK